MTSAPRREDRMVARLRSIAYQQQYRRQIFPLVLLVVLIALGTVGYMVIEGWSAGDALYMTIITMSTVGYKEVHDLDSPGRVLTSFLILSGVGVLFFSVTNLMTWIVETQMSESHSQQQRRNRIRDLRDHVIVCGYGRVGHAIVDELSHEDIPLVVIESNPQRFDLCLHDENLAVMGDATEDATLVEAGIANARGLAIALDDDAKNVFIALTGRALNPDIEIVARSGRRESEGKLTQAGAQRVVSPYAMSGQRMAALFTRPSVVDFIETTLRRGNVEFNLEEVTVPEASSLVGVTVQQVHERVGNDVTILAIITGQGLVPSPQPDQALDVHDTLIVVGRADRLKHLNEMASARNVPQPPS